jgi:plasmid stabilization system protein ParE
MPQRDSQGEFQVVVTTTAFEDVEAIVGYIEGEDPAAAERISVAIWSKCQSLRSMPARGTVVPELACAHVEGYRQVLVSPWRIIYRAQGSTILIVAILDGRRDVEEELLQRLKRPTRP